MNNIQEKEINEQLLGALERSKEMTRKMKEKQELKIWSEISVPFSLKDALTRLSKDELSDIRRRFEIKGASQLKKGELIDLLSKQIPLLLEMMFTNIDQERYDLMKQIIRNGGYIVDPDLAQQQAAYLRESGIAFTGTYEGGRILAMPVEIVHHPIFQENDQQLSAICRRNSEWIRLTQGLLYYYGTLTINELHDLLEKYTNEPVRLSNYLSVIDHAISYYKQIHRDEIGFSDFRVFDSKKAKMEHQMRKDLAFFPFTKEQLLKAGEPDYIERNASYIQFVQFLTQNYEIDREEADGIVEECVYATNIGESPNDILQYLQSRLEITTIDMFKAFMDHVVNMMNNSRQWGLKGYTPRELGAKERNSLLTLPDENKIIDFASKKKIGRNDPCPCGSGKKYKKCCGR
ncbi:YecA family protein [Neobacillus cucumis]|uniref:Zinc chelation protein SecC n=1 Tax=Neobacillus cucumis TaxID=1740721 RepID=A0A2N5HVR0_9BACI|nr:SEC-C metal-binding domain-containing protein [Neobacillus cucumis]PLS09601.1 hypothetical protein CVD27_01835 [Neobacillus cucumis]